MTDHIERGVHFDEPDGPQLDVLVGFYDAICGVANIVVAPTAECVMRLHPQDQRHFALGGMLLDPDQAQRIGEALIKAAAAAREARP